MVAKVDRLMGLVDQLEGELAAPARVVGGRVTEAVAAESTRAKMTNGG
jgi:hypothetical protein